MADASLSTAPYPDFCVIRPRNTSSIPAASLLELGARPRTVLGQQHATASWSEAAQNSMPRNICSDWATPGSKVSPVASVTASALPAKSTE